MKRKIDWDEEDESGQEDSTTSDEESDSEDPRGQLLRNQRIIPVTHISELVGYVFLLQNDDLAKPRALNTFMEGLAELGINKNLIKNRKLLSDLLEKEKRYRNEEEKFHNGADDGNSTNSDEEEASEEGSGAEESHESENDTDSNSDESTNSDSENTTIIQSKIPCEHCERSNVYETTILRRPKCSWHDTHLICPICDFNIPLKTKKNGKEGFSRCYDCGAIKHKNGKTSKTTYYPPSSDEAEEDY